MTVRTTFAMALVAYGFSVGCESPPERGDAEAAAEAAVPEPERVAPGLISTETRETFPAPDPVDGSLWFSRYEDGFDDQTIYVARMGETGWTTPEVAPFSGRYGDRAPRFSPDGHTLYFTSNRPLGEDAEGGDMNLWAVQRQPDGSWSEPQPLPAPVNSTERDIHASVTHHALYLASARDGGFGRSDIYRIPLENGGFGAAEHLPAPINDALSQPDLLVEPEERWMILVITDHPSGLGGDDLFLVRRTAEGWGALVHLPAPINSEEYEYGPTLSADGRHLYFTSHRGGQADVYRIPVSALDLTGGR